jgi:hypothetical protein
LRWTKTALLLNGLRLRLLPFTGEDFPIPLLCVDTSMAIFPKRPMLPFGFPCYLTDQISKPTATPKAYIGSPNGLAADCPSPVIIA